MKRIDLLMGSCYSDYDVIALRENLPLWTDARAALTHWKHPINRVGHPQFQYSEQTFHAIFGMMKEFKLACTVEARVEIDPNRPHHGGGGLDAQTHLSRLNRALDAGYAIDCFELDGAFSDYTLSGCSSEEALENLIEYFTVMRENLPDTRFYWLFNLPNWGWKGGLAYRKDHREDPDTNFGDAYAVYNYALPALRQAGIKLEGVIVDNPYEYMLGQWLPVEWERTACDLAATDWIGRILELEALVHADGMAFGLITNSQNGDTSDELFGKNSLLALTTYLDRGGKPDLVEFESWYPHPVHFLPDSRPDTMTGVVARGAEILRRRGLL